jgi:hypothetical protein
MLTNNTSEDFDNVDTPIFYSRKFDEYGVKIVDGGQSSILISHCPWCGQKLPDSKRDLWFYELGRLGIKDPWTEKLPERYLTDEWYGGRAIR